MVYPAPLYFGGFFFLCKIFFFEKHPNGWGVFIVVLPVSDGPDKGNQKAYRYGQAGTQ
jgi:hypothetical protein